MEGRKNRLSIRSLMKWIALLFIVIGIGVISFPFVQNQYVAYEQDKLLHQLEAEEGQEVSGEESLPQRYEELNAILDQEAASTTSPETKEKPSKNLIGKMEISAINLELPILNGASMENLKVAVGRLSGTGIPGEVGNTALAAHRSYKYGKLFNRLDEVKIGDSINIETGNHTYAYQVENVFRVLPTDLSVLKQPETGSILTLITCDPIQDPTHRLIVQASLVKTS
ncbi:class D sortase [Pontibacillus yanchengensis]|nr:class D sortase [Pontibacillus yanchengensis]